MRTETWRDARSGLDFVVEIYYPATDQVAGHDLDEATQDSFENQWEPGKWLRQAAVRDATPLDGKFPYVINMHGWAGFRVEFTYLSTHLASHGYLVVAPDIPGSTAGDVEEFFADPDIVGKPEALGPHAKAIRETRCVAVPYLVAAGLDKLQVLDEAVGFTGPSFGGWTALIAPRLDARIKATIAQCPAGGNVYHLPAKDREPATRAQPGLTGRRASSARSAGPAAREAPEAKVPTQAQVVPEGTAARRDNSRSPPLPPSQRT